MSSSTDSRIVVIEDNPAIAKMLEAALVSVGYQVVVAPTGREGLERVVKEFPAVVLLDLHLPDMHGGKVLMEIRANAATKTIPVIILTASEKIDDVVKAKSFGANGYVTKPFDPATLLATVGRYAKAPGAQHTPWSGFG